jgi:hypothetical protein
MQASLTAAATMDLCVLLGQLEPLTTFLVLVGVFEDVEPLLMRGSVTSLTLWTAFILFVYEVAPTITQAP